MSAKPMTDDQIEEITVFLKERLLQHRDHVDIEVVWRTLVQLCTSCNIEDVAPLRSERKAESPSETGFPHWRAVPRPYMIDIDVVSRIPRNDHGGLGVIVCKRR